MLRPWLSAREGAADHHPPVQLTPCSKALNKLHDSATTALADNEGAPPGRHHIRHQRTNEQLIIGRHISSGTLSRPRTPRDHYLARR